MKFRWQIASHLRLLADWLRHDQKAEFIQANDGPLICVREGFGITGDWIERGDTAELIESDESPGGSYQ